MKKLFFLAVLSLVCASASFGQVRIGAVLGYGTEVEQPALGINAEFFINEKMSIAPGLLFYFPQEVDNNAKVSFWEFNGNFQYYFLAEDAVSVYGIAGLNFMTAKIKYEDDLFDEDDSNNELGINLGIGTNFHIGGNILPFAELKYVASEYDQVVIVAGIKFPIRD